MSSRLRVTPTEATTLRYEPGNGTSYNLVIARDAQGGGSFLWLEGTRVYAAGWFGDNDVRWAPEVKVGKVDKAAIHAALGLPEAQAVLDERYRRWDRAEVTRG